MPDGSVAFAMIAAACAVIVPASALLALDWRRHRSDSPPPTPTEGGAPIVGDPNVPARVPFLVPLLACLPILVALLVLFPWVTVVRELGTASMFVFLVVAGSLSLGLVILWKRGGLEWTS